jgi:hypothetical protein
MANQKALQTIAYNLHTFSWQKLGEKNSHFDVEDICFFKVLSGHSQIGSNNDNDDSQELFFIIFFYIAIICTLVCNMWPYAWRLIKCQMLIK